MKDSSEVSKQRATCLKGGRFRRLRGTLEARRQWRADSEEGGTILVAASRAVLLAVMAGCGTSDGDGLTNARATQSAGTGVVLPVGSLAGDVGNRQSCAGITIEAENQRGPADIIFALDNSGSMDEEASFVQDNMNVFSEQIVASAVDAHVVVISSYPGEGNGICIDAPLGSGACPGGDSNAPFFLHVDREVDSNNALELMIDTFPTYRSSLRPEAQKHLVVVTDDESDLSAAQATAGLLRLDPPMFEGFIFHGIYAFTEGEGDHCDELSSGEGTQYRELVANTDGVEGDLCLQDFKPVFDRLAQAVVGRSRLACEWSIPAPPPGAEFDPTLTNLQYSSLVYGPLGVPRAPSAGDCSSAVDGWAWHYDTAVDPTSIVLCPDACSAIRADEGAKVDVQFGCPTVEVPR